MFLGHRLGPELAHGIPDSFTDMTVVVYGILLLWSEELSWPPLKWNIVIPDLNKPTRMLLI